MSRTDRHKPYLVQVADMNGKTAPKNWRTYQGYNVKHWRKRHDKLAKQGYTSKEIRDILEAEERELFGPEPRDYHRHFAPNSTLRKFYANKENKRQRRKGKRIDPDLYENEPTPRRRSIAWFID